MSSYRFCRTDDIPLLVQAYNACYRVHFPDLPEMQVDDFKRLTREWNLWASSCMVAFDGSDPVAVLLAAKRETENLITHIGVRPGHQRRGHGRHLMTSLSAKMAILGPPRLLLELPVEVAEALQFFKACGYTRDRELTDFSCDPIAEAPAAAALIQSVTVEELAESGALEFSGYRCWSRARQTLHNKRKRLIGKVIAPAERIEGFVLADLSSQGTEIAALEVVDSPQAQTLGRLLVETIAAESSGPVLLPRVSAEESTFSMLEAWGMTPGLRTLGLSAPARPG